MSAEILMVLAILATFIVLLVTEWMPLEVITLLVLGVLAVTGILSPFESLSGFSNPVTGDRFRQDRARLLGEGFVGSRNS